MGKMGSDLNLSVKMNENFQTGLPARGGINRILLNTVYPVNPVILSKNISLVP